MKKILMLLLAPTFGSKRFIRFYTILKNISFLGLNYRGTDITNDGELFFIKTIRQFYKDQNEKIILFDVGANVGNYARVLDKEFAGVKRMIFSFEPFSSAFKKLEQLSGVIPDFNPVYLGLGDKTEKINFLSSTEFSEVGGLYNKDFSKYNFSLDLNEVVQFETIHAFCKQQGINKIHFLKIDVEGHDYFVLKGASDLLANRQIDFIQFEFGAANYLSKTYLYDFFQLLSPNYRFYRLLKNGFEEISVYNTDIEIHIQSNFIAISKDVSFKTC